jgi:hypothetical protein
MMQRWQLRHNETMSGLGRHLGQANLDVAIDVHLATDIHILLGIGVGHQEGGHCASQLHEHLHTLSQEIGDRRCSLHLPR